MATARVDARGFTAMLRGLTRVTGGGLEKDLVVNLQAQGPKIVSDMKSKASTRIERRGASSVTARRETRGFRVAGGEGGGLGTVLFDGSEYGGRSSRKVTYATRSPLGNVYVMRRRTTMQFKVWLGREGHYFWPTIRDWMPKLEQQASDLTDAAMGGRGR